MTEIIDLTQPPKVKEPKPIKLVACLQSSKINGKDYLLYEADYSLGITLKKAKTIKKLSNLEGYKSFTHFVPLCLLEVDGLICLAEWNDGTLPT